MSRITFEGKGQRYKPWKIFSAWGLSLLLLFGQTVPILGNPTGGTVVAGSATIGGAGQTLNINQTTQSAIINWQQFSIASGETTKFLVPNSAAATLNRVYGGNPSLIYGSLQSNGILYLVNPSGIVVGPSGRIDTASFLASTLDVSNEQFLAGGNLEFSGASDAAIDNEGTIHASTGDVYLIANRVNNAGTLSAPQGNVGLAAGSDVLFQSAGDQHLFVQPTPAGTTRATGVTNSGTIRAAAAELKAAGGNAYALAINNTGEIAATGFKKVNGQVYLVANGGNITNSGKISAKTASGNGGTIVVDGSATTSATSGVVTNSGTLNASATVAGGQGGSVTLKNSKGTTIHSGAIIAQGGQGGAGGDADVSGLELSLTGSVDLTASGGTTGNLLIDPATLTVITGGSLGSGSFTSSGGTDTNPTDSGANDTVDPSVVEGLLATANLTLNADTNVTITDGITWTSANTLTLSTNTAGSTIDINAAISGVNGGLTIDTRGASTDLISATAGVDVSSFILQSGNWSQSSPTLPAFSATQDFELQGSSIFLRVSGGTGAAGSPYQITDIYGLQGLGSSGALLTSSAVLMNGIDATGTATWNGGAGFVPIGKYDGASSDAASYSGTFNGQDNTIGGLKINLPSDLAGVGLFGDTASSATLENLNLVDFNITGSQYVGTLVGVGNATVRNVNTSGSVTGTTYVGGLEGISYAAISNSYSVASVNSTTAGFALGGLIGYEQGGSITDCYSSGLVTGGNGSSNMGGLLGLGGGTVSNSFWDTTTSGQSTSAGGTGDPTSTLLSLATYSAAGWNIGTNLATDTWVIIDGETRPMLTSEYSTTITDAHQLQLIGLNATTLAANYTLIHDIYASGTSNASDVWGTLGFEPIGNGATNYSGTFNGQNFLINGLTISMAGNNNVGLFSQTTSAATLENVGLTSLTVTGDAQVGGLVGTNAGTITNTYTTGTVTGTDNVGGLVGDNNGTISGSYNAASISSPNSGDDDGGLVGLNLGGITDSYSTGTVTAGNQTSPSFGAVGGLVGYNSGTLGSVYSSGAVTTGTDSTGVGGLVGESPGGTITNAYSTGAVTVGTSSFQVGGLVGMNGATVSDTYSSGLLTTGSGTTDLGGLIGYNDGTVTNSFWDTTTSGITNTNQGIGIGIGSGVTGEFTTNLLDETTYSSAGWNISTNSTSGPWIIFNGQTRPMLSMEYSTTISNAHQLQLIDLNPTTLAASYTVSGNIDLTGTTNASDVWGTSTSNAGAGFVPIGNTSNMFTGTFNGTRHVLSGLYILTPTANNVGLFGISSGTIENVALANVEVTGASDVGGLVGAIGNTAGATPGIGTLSDVIVTGNVIGSGSYIGGLVGLDHGTSVFSAFTEGTVTGVSFVGGLEGSTLSQLSDVYSTATVGASGGPVGGLVGENFSGGSILDAYSTGVVTGQSEVGALVGRNLGTITDSYWDTTTSFITSLTGGVGSGTNSGVTGVTTTQLETQTYPASWNFTSVWTTDNGAELPQLLDSANSAPIGSSNPPPSGGSGTDTLNGTAYSDSGVMTDLNGVTIELFVGGSMQGSTTTNGSGGFSFSVTAADLTGGLLLSDTSVDGGNTYYQTNTPVSTINDVNIWANTIRVMADTASNSALAAAAGSQMAGIDYGVTNNNLVSADNSFSILSHYTLDGNITATSITTAPTAVLTGSTDVTLTGATVAMAGTFNLSGSLALTATAGSVTLSSVGTQTTPATADGLTLTATGPATVNTSFLALGGGTFTASGTGDTVDLNGVNILSSVIDTQGGSISLTGQSNSVNSESEGGIVSGVGVDVDTSTLETAPADSEITTGGITIMGNGSPGVETTTVNNLVGTYITNSTLSVVNGALSVTGDVDNGTAQAVLVDGSASDFTGRTIGLDVDDGSHIASTGTGSVTLAGNTTNSTAQISNLGVDLSSLNPNTSTTVTSTVSAAGGLGINVMGTAGAVSDSPSGADVQTPSSTGLVVEFGTQITATGSAPISLQGTGGNDENTITDALTNEGSEGLSIEASPSDAEGDSPDILISSVSGAITLMGTSGNSIGGVDGLEMHSESGATAAILSASGNISLTGIAANTADQTTNPNSSGDGGVDIGVDNSTGSTSSITASAGSIYINGSVTSGTLNSKEAGVVVTRSATITASGTGGTAGATAQGDLTIVGTTAGTTAESLNGGVFIEGAGSKLSASGIVADAYGGTGLTITGTSSAIDGSTGGTVGGDNETETGGVSLDPLTAGIVLANGAELQTLGSSPISLNGTSGANSNSLASQSTTPYIAPDGGTSGSYGVDIFSPVAGATTTVSSGGNFSVIGQAGSSPTTGVGLMIGGPSNVGAVSITSSGAITLNGTGGTGNVTNSPVPNAGVAIFNPGNDSGTVGIAANGGNLSITGASGGGTNSVGVDGIPYSNTVDDLPSNDPALRASGSLLVTSTAGLVNDTGWAGEMTSLSTFVTAPVGTTSVLTADPAAGPLSLSGGNFIVTSFPVGSVTLAASTVGTLAMNDNGGTNINGIITASGNVDIQDTGGNIIFGSGGSISDSGDGASVILAAGTALATSHYIINNSSNSTPIQVPGGNFYLYSSDPTYDSFGVISMSVLQDDLVYNATYETADLPAADEELFYVAASGDVGPNIPGGSVTPPPSTTTGGAAGGGSNIVPPALTPQTTAPLAPPAGADPGAIGDTPPPAVSFGGNGPVGDIGAPSDGLAGSSGSGGQVGSGDAAQLGGGQLNNVASPAAAGALNMALSIAVYHSLSDALAALGDWQAPDATGDNDTGGGGQETILTGGDVAVMGDNGVKQIPLGQAPPQLQQAMSDDVRKGMNGGSGH